MKPYVKWFQTNSNKHTLREHQNKINKFIKNERVIEIIHQNDFVLDPFYYSVLTVKKAEPLPKPLPRTSKKVREP